MTDPLDDYPMPYAIQYEASSAGNNFVIPADQRNWAGGVGDARLQHDISPGVYSIMATYDGSEGVTVQTYRKYTGPDGVEVLGWRALGTIPAGIDGNARRSDILMLSIPPQASSPSGYTRIMCSPTAGVVQPASAQRGRIITLQIFPAEIKKTGGG